MTKRKEFNIRFSAAEKLRAKELSLQAGYKSISGYVRSLIFCPRRMGAKETELRFLIIIGNSLHSMAEFVAQGKPVLAKDIRENLELVVAFIRERRHARRD